MPELDSLSDDHLKAFILNSILEVNIRFEPYFEELWRRYNEKKEECEQLQKNHEKWLKIMETRINSVIVTLQNGFLRS